MSDIKELFDRTFKPIEESFKELIEDAIETKNGHMLWTLKEVAEGRKP